ncbi:MAG: hypothetical protein U1C74_07465 [Phenylobacterium sp.]|nr:hypothetical protein [Phenylobacterium sp.]
MNHPNIRDFRAVESVRDMAGNGRNIRVTGEVELTSTGARARLTRRSPQGIIASTLVLVLEVTPGGGGAAMTWREVDYAEDISPGQFNKVTVQMGEATLVEMPVDEVHS